MGTGQPQHRFKMCPFRQGHFCGNCELLDAGADKCIFKLINLNLELLASDKSKR